MLGTEVLTVLVAAEEESGMEAVVVGLRGVVCRLCLLRGPRLGEIVWIDGRRD